MPAPADSVFVSTPMDLDIAYYERNQLVALLATMYPSGTAQTPIAGWAPEWFNCVYIDLPTGQVSWHYHDREAAMFSDLPTYRGTWDGHDTAEKYRRVNLLREMRSAAINLGRSL